MQTNLLNRICFAATIIWNNFTISQLIFVLTSDVTVSIKESKVWYDREGENIDNKKWLLRNEEMEYHQKRIVMSKTEDFSIQSKVKITGERLLLNRSIQVWQSSTDYFIM